MLDASSSPAPAQNPSSSTSSKPLERSPAENSLESAKLPPLFSLGRIVSTPGAMLALLEADGDLGDLLRRHWRGDWGDLSADDKARNDDAVGRDERLLSAYVLPATQKKVWIITEADRSTTTLLLPEEY